MVKYILPIFLLFAILNPPGAKAQNWYEPNYYLAVPGGLQAVIATYGPVKDNGQNWYLWEYDLWPYEAGTILVMISNVPLAAWQVWVDGGATPGWEYLGAGQDDQGRATVAWLRTDGGSAPTDQWTTFQVWGYGAGGVSGGGGSVQSSTGLMNIFPMTVMAPWAAD